MGGWDQDEGGEEAVDEETGRERGKWRRRSRQLYRSLTESYDDDDYQCYHSVASGGEEEEDEEVSLECVSQGATVYIYMYIYIEGYAYIYIYRERERVPTTTTTTSARIARSTLLMAGDVSDAEVESFGLPMSRLKKHQFNQALARGELSAEMIEVWTACKSRHA